jgi:hypothetical protein
LKVTAVAEGVTRMATQQQGAVVVAVTATVAVTVTVAATATVAALGRY